MISYDVILIAVLSLAVLALLVAHFARRKSHDGQPAASRAPSDRWVVLEIERKDTTEDGYLWEVHDNWELRDHSEAAR
jgi:hypothetical protein